MNIKGNEQKNIQKIISSNGDSIEKEVRFGHFKKNGFNPELDTKGFIRMNGFIKKFSNMKSIEYSFLSHYKNGKKMIQYLQTPLSGSGGMLSYPDSDMTLDTVCIIKRKLSTCDIKNYGIRFQLSEEIPCESPGSDDMVSFLKARKRIIYEWGGLEFHLSMFQEGYDLNGVKASVIKYDIEIEIITMEDYDGLMKFIDTFMKAYQDTGIVYDIKELSSIKTKYKKITGGNKPIVVQPNTLRSDKYVPDEDYGVTLKLDGERRMIMLYDNKVITFNSKMNICILNIEITTRDNTVSIFDSEFYMGKYYLFDTIVYENQDLRHQKDVNLLKRVEYYTRIFSTINDSRFLFKEYLYGNTYKNTIQLMKNEVYKHDGVILVPVNYPYPLKNKGPGVPLKYKPQGMNTIDFRIKKIEDGTVWELYCYDKDNDVLFSHSDYIDIGITRVEPELSCKFMNMSIVECYYDKRLRNFQPIRQRHDKFRGNHISIALDNFDTIIHPFVLEWLNKNKTPSNFFNYHRFSHYVKRVFINKIYKQTPKALWINCEDGGHMQKFIDFNIKDVTACDVDENNIKTSLAKYDKMIENPTCKNFRFNFSNIDMRKKVKPISQDHNMVLSLDDTGVFFENTKTLENFVKNINNNTEKDAIIVLSMMNNKFIKENNDINMSDLSITTKKNVLNIKHDNIASKTYTIDDDILIDTMVKYDIEFIEETAYSLLYPEWSSNDNFLNNSEFLYSACHKIMVFKKKL